MPTRTQEHQFCISCCSTNLVSSSLGYKCKDCGAQFSKATDYEEPEGDLKRDTVKPREGCTNCGADNFTILNDGLSYEQYAKWLCGTCGTKAWYYRREGRFKQTTQS